MSLAAGSRVGGYEIVSLLGRGGMGEVWRATDTRLKRQVALKVLPAAFIADPERIARFQREAELLAALNHPNIAQIYGIEEADCVTALVLELVEGPTLADRIAEGPIPVDEALPIARQMAEALEAAHEQGIIHRDLKPANIKLRPDGTVKVLDFGLAKLAEPTVRGAAQVVSPLTQSPTITSPAMATGIGVLLGTAPYMSPEQAKGRAADKRSDVWAFGCVLFEMLTGTRAFEGDNVTDTLAGVLRSEPDLGRLSPETPPSIRRLTRRCLQKDPQRRLAHIGMARIEIDDSVDELLLEPPPVAKAGARPVMLRSIATATIGAVIGGLFVVAALRNRTPADSPEIRFSFAPPEGATFGHSVFGRGSGPAAPQFAPSPDGSRLAYVMFTTGEPRLWVRRFDSIAGQPLPGTEDASFPFWSPDGRFIGFFAQGKLKTIDASGGTPHTVCDAPAGEGGTWNRDGQIVFAPEGAGALFRVSSAGGVPSAVTQLDQSHNETSHRWPQFLPDGRHFLYLAIGGTTEERGTYRASLDASTRQLVLKNPVRIWYTASGHLLFMRNGVLLAQPFDARSLRLSDDPKPIAESVPYNVANGRAAFGVSDTGVLAYRTDVDMSEATSQIMWFDRTGKRLETIHTSGEIASLRLSPDEKQLAFSRRNRSSGVSDIWTLDLGRGAVASRVTTAPERLNRAPIWSPEGAHLVFAASYNGVADLFDQAASGVGDATPVLRTALPKIPTDWSRDGRFIAYYAADPKTKNDLWILPVSPPGKPKLFLQTPFAEGNARISPDGKWIAYESDEGGAFDIYVRSFPDGHRKWRISLSGGVSPEWRQDGKELFYLSGARLMAVATNGGSEFAAGAPQPLFENSGFLGRNFTATVSRYAEGIAVGSTYAVAANGQRFLTASLEPLKDVAGEAIILVVNWPATLRR
jgi:eukaryotic-like serine/threonine-protein kinase